MYLIKQILNNKQGRALLVFTIVAFGVIFYFHLSAAKGPRSYVFDRVFSKTDTTLVAGGKPETLTLPEYESVVSTDSGIICLYQGFNDSGNYSYQLRAYDYRFSKKDVIDLKIPKNSNVLFSAAGITMYTNLYHLYAYDHATGTSRRINIKGLRVFELTRLNDSATSFLCLGELNNGSQHETGFYTIDIAKDQITAKGAIIETNEDTKAAQLMLKYAGNFVADHEMDRIAYYCNKYSKIYFFNTHGESIRELHTLDKTPAPEIISDKRGINSYKRGATWLTNTGVLFRDKHVLVFSTRSIFKDCILVDVYSMEDFSYLHSYRLKCENRKTSEIYRVFSDKERLIIVFDNYHFASFVYSPYNG